MSHKATFPNSLFLGFEEVERIAEKIARNSGEGYPPYNIEKISHSDGPHLRITLAVAGFSSDDLDITLENRQLVIRGRQTPETGREYLYRGIAARQFQKSFVLADGIKVKGAALDNGLLTVHLFRPTPAETARQIKINAV